jgi:hypothetical protein
LLAALLMSVAQAAPSVVRVGMPAVPHTLDPARAQFSAEFTVMAGIYDTLYALDPLSQNAALVPLAAAALPDLSANGRVYTIRILPGIFFASHPVFGGKLRELTAGDFAYSISRILDPALRSPSASTLEGVQDVTALDRTTLRITLKERDPLFIYNLAYPLTGAVAREAVEAEGEQYGQRPGGHRRLRGAKDDAGPAHDARPQSRLPRLSARRFADRGFARAGNRAPLARSEAAGGGSRRSHLYAGILRGAPGACQARGRPHRAGAARTGVEAWTAQGGVRPRRARTRASPDADDQYVGCQPSEPGHRQHDA